MWCQRQQNSRYSGKGRIKKRASEQVNHTECIKNSNKSKTKFKVVARPPATKQKRPLSPVISARTGDNFPPQNRTQSHEEPSLQQTKNWRDWSMPLQRRKPENSTSATGLHPTHRSPFWLLKGDHTPCNQALRWPGGSPAHGLPSCNLFSLVIQNFKQTAFLSCSNWASFAHGRVN